MQHSAPLPTGDPGFGYDPAQAAVQLAQGYFAMIAGQAGVAWDRGNDAEIELLVGAIIDAARQDPSS